MTVPHPPRERTFRISRQARDRYGLEVPLGGVSGHVVATDRAAIRRLAASMNAARTPGVPSAQAGELAALVLMHEIFHLVVERYEDDFHPEAMVGAIAHLDAGLGAGATDVLDAFGREFPDWGGGAEPRAVVVEELVLTRVANENPAAGPLRDLFDDRPVAAAAPYARAVEELGSYFGTGPAFGPDGETLLELLRAPARHSPTSLLGQLRYIREQWAALLGDLLARLLGEIDLTLGLLAEEEHAMHLRFGGGHGGFGGRAEAPGLGGLDPEVERFSSDSAWMPGLVIMAKSTYVWLDQLSRKYQRDIHTLDAIPDEELDRLAGWGITGLWLIGLWERSRASERIKRMRGNPDAVASAYSLDDYRIADDLGGEPAYTALRDRAWARGVRLASDMVPNHMGIDSRWVVEHPDWFLSLPEPPYPGYSFNGADLSSDDRVGIVLEDHYWDNSDAAVVFKRFDRHTGDQRFIYHGNDGTSFPWNDTAQLDFLNPDVREAVIQTVLAVARRFPVIRFDAAMVLAKKHIERLWWPEPGSGGGIPSRAEHAMPRDEFDRRMPVEFWREVVDRVAQEVPDTLLLAEAFWLLEGYFVRTLGMHRVYNSAFMHMLRDEDNAGYRKLIKETLEFDPRILKRYVNFMNNPDEETAIEQFGDGDKYFGVAMLLATLPGLPMLGHGQVEGFREKYGMEFRRARLDEQPNQWLVDRHEREIVPLLRARGDFAEADNFLLYDVWKPDGQVDEDVFAYSNGSGAARSLTIYHNRFASTVGTIRESVPVRQASGQSDVSRRTLAAGLELDPRGGPVVAFRDVRGGLEYLRHTQALVDGGLHLDLQAYEGHVFRDFRQLPDPTGTWARLTDRLGGRGVPSIADAMREQGMQLLHDQLRALLYDGVAPLVGSAAGLDGLPHLRDQYIAFLEALASVTNVPLSGAGSIAEVVLARLGRAFRPGGMVQDIPIGDRAALAAGLLFTPMGQLAPGADPRLTGHAWYDELGFAPIVAEWSGAVGVAADRAGEFVALTRTLIVLPRPSQLSGDIATRVKELFEGLAGTDGAPPTGATALTVPGEQAGLTVEHDVEQFDPERFTAIVDWAVRIDEAEQDTGDPRERDQAGGRLKAAADAAGYRVAPLRELLAARQDAGTARGTRDAAPGAPAPPPAGHAPHDAAPSTHGPPDES